MVGPTSAQWNQLGQWSPTAFIVGGFGILVLGVVGGLDTAAVVLTPAWLHASLMLGGLLFVFIGLLGYYPYVAQFAPRLSRVGVLSSVLGGIALTVGLAGSIVVTLTSNVMFGEGPSWGPPLLAVAFVLVLLSFLVYGIASSRSAAPSRTVGLLFLVPFVAFLGQAALLISKIVTGDILPVIQLSLAGITGVAIIAAGLLLRDETTSANYGGSRVDQTV